MRYSLDFTHHAWERDASAKAPARTLAVATAADKGGIDAIWVSEDLEGWDAFALLSAIATVTEQATLGTSVISPYPRRPNLLAASVATVDRLSGGRAALGIGRGQPDWNRSGLGVEAASPLADLRETIGLLRQWWTPPYRATSPASGQFGVQDWERVIHPVAGDVPVYLAAAGPRALDLAGELADGAIFNALTSDAVLAEAVPRVRRAAAGRDPDALAFILRTPVTVTEEAVVERQALMRGKTMLALVLALPGMEQLVLTPGFDVPALLAEVRRLMRTDEVLTAGGGFAALRRGGDLSAARALIPDDLIRQLGIIGPLPVVRERLAALTALGITHVSLTPPADAASAGAWRRLLRDIGDG